MQYMGGKYRIAKHLAPIIIEGAGDRDRYVEPFLGAGSVFTRLAPAFTYALGLDVMPDLVYLWSAVQHGWVPPLELSEEEYARLRHAEPSALRGFAGFACSFGGKFFGGYARDPRNGGRNFADTGSRSIRAKLAQVPHACFAVGDYLAAPVDSRTVVYADPPYAGTTSYAGAPPWDADRFWLEARRWVEAGAAVYVSEYEAPEDWTAVWEGTPQGSLSLTGKTGRRVRERLYTYAANTLRP